MHHNDYTVLTLYLQTLLKLVRNAQGHSYLIQHTISNPKTCIFDNAPHFADTRFIFCKVHLLTVLLRSRFWCMILEPLRGD